MREMWRAMATQRWRLLAAAFFGVIAAASTVALLGTSGWLISYAAEMPPVLSLGIAAVMVRSFALSRSVFRYLERLMGHDAAFRGLTDLRVTIYERLERLSPVGLLRFGRGDLLARLVADVDAALDLPLRVVLPWVQAAVVSAATVAFLAWLVPGGPAEPALSGLPGAGLALGTVLLIGLVVVPWIVARIAARAELRLAPARGDLSESVVSSLDGAADLLAFGAVDAAVADVGRRDDELTSVAKRESAGLGLGVGLSTALQGAAVVACLVAAIPAVVDGRIAPVWLAVAALLPLAAYDVVSTLPTSALAYQRVRGSARRLNEVLDAPDPVHDPREADPLPRPPLPLNCRGLVAAWSHEPVLRGIDLDLAAGERVAVVGPSGAGKSTLAMVLLRFLDYSGSVELSGTQLSALDGDAIREEVGLLTQDAHIFDTTVRENLHLGDPRASDDELRAVLARVGLAGWLTHLPGGLDCDLGPHGAAISGGERQRLALARLMLADRRLLVLDEPTEHLDPQAADALTDDVLTVTAGRSTLLITHRLHGLDRVDRIIVLVAGRVRAVGTHAELVAQGGWYAERWRAEQERGDLADLIESIPAGTALTR